MKNILILGAGRSASSLIQYLLEEGKENNWTLTLADADVEMAAEKVAGYENGKAIPFNVKDDIQRVKAIAEADLVISMMPARFHPLVAETCIEEGKDMLSASYVPPEIEAMDGRAKANDVLILKECGLDPGIDHMSAMKIIHHLKDKGAKMEAFYSYTGGLIAPESDNNPWKYKFTWNPRNVVLAGQGVAKYIENGHYKFVPYYKLFERTQPISVEGYGDFEGYANRDSLSYRALYEIEDIPTLLRGTLRRKGYCEAWRAFVHLGMTDDSYPLINLSEMTWKEFTRTFLPEKEGLSVEDVLCEYTGIARDGHIFKKLEWLGLFEDKKIGMEEGTPAQVLEKLLSEKWRLEKEDKDMIVMQHRFDYELAGKKQRMFSSMVVKGDDSTYTAMAKTVGLPLGIAAKLMLENKIHLKGVHIPTKKEIYLPILEALEKMGISFEENTVSV